MPRRTTCCALVALAATPIAAPIAWADENTAADTIEEIRIEAVRREVPAEALPNTIRLLGRQEIRDQLLISTNIVDIISSQVPSFSPSRQKLSGAGESFRGREPLYLIDGVPQSNPLRNGSRDGFTIDPSVIERVEILFGANAIQGVGATGGTINYVTLRPSDDENWELRAEAGLTASNDLDGDGFATRTAFTALKDFGALDLVAGVAYEDRGIFYDGEGRRIGIDGTQGDIQDSRTLNFFLKTGVDIDEDMRLQFTANIFDLDGDGDYVQVAGDRATGTPAISVRGDQEGIAPTNQVATFSADFNHADLFGGTFTAQAFYREFEAVFGGGTFGGFFNTGNEAPGELTFDQSANNSNKTGVKLTYSNSNLGIDGFGVTGGVDYLRDKTFQELAQTGRLWVPEVVFNSFAPFVQFDQTFWDDRVLISGGIRQEIAELSVDDFTTIFSSGSTAVSGGAPDFSETLFNGGISIEVADGVKLYASYAEGFTMPDVGRVLRAINTPGLDVDNLLNIDPIVADNTEFGVSVDKGGFSANFSYFISESAFGQRLFANPEGIFEVRREPTEIDGFEASLEYAFGDALLVGANYAALEGQSDQDGDGLVDEDLSAENISPDRLNFYLAATPTENSNVRVQVSQFMDRSFNDASTATDFEGYTLVDLLAGYNFEGFGRIDIGVQNLFNESYTTYFSQAAPSAVTRGNRFFNGRGRSFTLRWSARY